MSTPKGMLWKATTLLIVGGGVAFGEAQATHHRGLDSFGMVGIVDGQTARLNVVNISTQLPPGPCMVELMFMDSMGMVLAQTTLDLMQGHAAFHDFSFDDVVGTRPTGRLQIRPEAMLLGGPDTRGRCLVVPTLEVYDNATMQTMIFFGLTPTLVQGPQPHL